MNIVERVCTFDCQGEQLVGIVSEPAQPTATGRGLLFAVGGPQYRAGSHRQFTLMARNFAAQGIPVMRFDYRGMGDSSGAPRAFDATHDDLRAAIDHFMQTSPGVREVVLFGLCDAASAIALYASRDVRVSGLILVNPWVRTEQGAARAMLTHYYVRRLFQRELWSKVARADFNYGAAFRSLRSLTRAARAPSGDVANETVDEVADDAARARSSDAPNDFGAPRLVPRMLASLRRFPGRVLILLSTEDLTAHEFSDLLSGSRDWRALTADARFRTFNLPGADHTFSRREWRERANGVIRGWLATP